MDGVRLKTTSELVRCAGDDRGVETEQQTAERADSSGFGEIGVHWRAPFE